VTALPIFRTKHEVFADPDLFAGYDGNDACLRCGRPNFTHDWFVFDPDSGETIGCSFAHPNPSAQHHYALLVAEQQRELEDRADRIDAHPGPNDYVLARHADAELRAAFLMGA
jgi:hypothetical protein